MVAKTITSDATRQQFERHFRKAELTRDQIAAGLETGCWVWQDTKDPDGYGQFRWNRYLFRAHRFAYLHYIMEADEMTPGMDVDHLCNNRACVNPEHLELVTHAENIRRQKEREALGGISKDAIVLQRAATQSEEALQWCVEFIDTNKVVRPADAKEYGVTSMEGALWREYETFTVTSDETNHAHILLSLFLYAISMGVQPVYALNNILGVTKRTLFRWLAANADWRSDYDTARREGQAARTQALRATVEDTLEARAPFASFRDVARVYESLLKDEQVKADRRVKRNEQRALPSGPTINFLFPPGTTPADIAALTDRMIEATATEVPVEPSTPALPPPSEWDEDFDEDE